MSIPLSKAYTDNDANPAIMTNEALARSFRYGDILQLQLHSNNNFAALYDFALGGISISRKMDSRNLVYGASTSKTKFAFRQSGSNYSPDILEDGSTLQVIVDGKRSRVIARATNGPLATTEFNSLDTLSTALGKINDEFGVRTLITEVQDNQLYIRLRDPNGSLRFVNQHTNSQHGHFLRQQLGLCNIAASSDDVKTFNNLSSLKNQITDCSNGKITANCGGGMLTVKVAAAATDALQISAVRGAKRLVDDYPVQGNGRVSGSMHIFLISSKHGLKIGDYVQLTDIYRHPDGVYMITSASEDKFSVGVPSLAALPASDLSPRRIVLQETERLMVKAAPRCRWQRVLGQTYQPHRLASFESNINARQFNIFIAEDDARSYAVDDCVYLSVAGDVDEAEDTNDYSIDSDLHCSDVDTRPDSDLSCRLNGTYYRVIAQSPGPLKSQLTKLTLARLNSSFDAPAIAAALGKAKFQRLGVPVLVEGTKHHIFTTDGTDPYQTDDYISLTNLGKTGTTSTDLTANGNYQVVSLITAEPVTALTLVKRDNLTPGNVSYGAALVTRLYVTSETAHYYRVGDCLPSVDQDNDDNADNARSSQSNGYEIISLITAARVKTLTLVECDNIPAGSVSFSAEIITRRLCHHSTIRKVGALMAGDNLHLSINGAPAINFNRPFLQIVASSSMIRVYIHSDHCYQVGSNFNFYGLTSPIIIGGLTIDVDRSHTICETGNGWIEFDNAVFSQGPLTPPILATTQAVLNLVSMA